MNLVHPEVEVEEDLQVQLAPPAQPENRVNLVHPEVEVEEDLQVQLAPPVQPENPEAKEYQAHLVQPAPLVLKAKRLAMKNKS